MKTPPRSLMTCFWLLMFAVIPVSVSAQSDAANEASKDFVGPPATEAGSPATRKSNDTDNLSAAFDAFYDMGPVIAPRDTSGVAKGADTRPDTPGAAKDFGLGATPPAPETSDVPRPFARFNPSGVAPLAPLASSAEKLDSNFADTLASMGSELGSNEVSAPQALARGSYGADAPEAGTLQNSAAETGAASPISHNYQFDWVLRAAYGAEKVAHETAPLLNDNRPANSATLPAQPPTGSCLFCKR